MKIEIEKLPKKTYKIKITIEAEKVKEAYNHVVEQAVKNSEIAGFRKGAAPANLVEAGLDKTKARGEIINHLVPSAYDQAIKETLIKPILMPKIEILQYADGQDLILQATTCEAPEIKLGDYKHEISELRTSQRFGRDPDADAFERHSALERRNFTSGQNSEPILGPNGQPISGGAGEPEKKAPTDPEPERITMVLKALMDCSAVEISDLFVEEEVNHMLARLVDQTGRLGLTVDQYLASVGKDVEVLKKDYWETAQKSLKMEFLLAEVAKAEGVRVDETEISATIEAAPDEETKKKLSETGSRPYIRSILIKNKTIQRLLELSDNKRSPVEESP